MDNVYNIFNMDYQDPDRGVDPNLVFEPDDYLYFYGDVLGETRTQKEIEFLIKQLELDRPMKILDLACGFGRHANRLAVLGHEVTGLDIMPGFLNIAQRDASQMGIDVKYTQKDMREITFYQEFDRILLIFTSFGYFDDRQNLKYSKT
jgi:ubiquinone/menaquinone biosynthesis C-methylase UbiE